MLTCRRGSEAPNGLKGARVLRHLVPMMSGLIHRLNADTDPLTRWLVIRAAEPPMKEDESG